MVNTFLPYADYNKSARALDNQRLGKQRAEAKSIIRIIEYMFIVQQRYNLEPLPDDPYKHYQWVRDIIAYYKKLRINLLYRNGQWHEINRSLKMYRLPEGRSVVESSNGYCLISNDGKYETHKTFVSEVDINPGIVNPTRVQKRKQYVQHSMIVQSDEIWVTLAGGYCYHPATLMWLAHLDSLKDYFNCVVDAWVERGNVNSMAKYDIPDGVIKPCWVHDFKFQDSQRSNLAKKLPEHYRQYFPYVRDDIPYFWPYALIVGSDNGEADDKQRYFGGRTYMRWYK